MIFCLSLIIVGIEKKYSLFNFGIFYYIGIILSSILLLLQIISVNLNDPNDCLKKFKFNKRIGFIIFIFISISNYFQNN
jgi:4-hydroxybenzoate polyprenyltransferase